MGGDAGRFFGLILIGADGPLACTLWRLPSDTHRKFNRMRPSMARVLGNLVSLNSAV